MTDAEVKAALSDHAALAITIDGEARGDSREGQSSVEERVAVGCVIRNRLQRPRRFGISYRAICVARGQFSCWFTYGGLDNYRRTMAIARSFVEAVPFPTLSALETALFAESAFLARGIIEGHLLDRVNQADHYYAPAAMKPAGSVPPWAEGQVPVARVGRHLFFRLP